MNIQIKHKSTDAVLCEFEAANISDCVEQAVKLGVDLSWANLGGTDLREANLGGADLRLADLSDAYLSDAYLSVDLLI